MKKEANERAIRQAEEKVKRETKEKTKKHENNNDDENQAQTLVNEAIQIYETGRATEAAGKISAALDHYILSATKLNEAASIKLLETILESYLKIMAAMLRNEAFEESEHVLDRFTTHFPNHKNEIDFFKKSIENQSWSPDYMRERLKADVLYHEIIGHL